VRESKLDMRRVMTLHTQGKTLGEIARTCGTTVSNIAKRMKQRGFPRRTPKERSKVENPPGRKSTGAVWQQQGHAYCWRKKDAQGRARNVGVHTLVAERVIARRLLPNEVVHHKDLNPANNAEENLCVMDRMEHMYLHRLLGDVGIRLLIAGEVEVVLSALDSVDYDLVYQVYVAHLCILEGGA